MVFDTEAVSADDMTASAMKLQINLTAIEDVMISESESMSYNGRKPVSDRYNQNFGM